MKAERLRSLKRRLDRFYREYDFSRRVASDPIEFPHRYRDTGDIEVSGFIASCLAYGRVDLFKPVVGRILALMGKSPFQFLLDFKASRQRRRFNCKYRFNEREDILCLLQILHTVLTKHGSLRNAFFLHYSPEEPDVGHAIAGLVQDLLSADTSGVYGKNTHPPGLRQFLPSPAKGSTCKRMNLFLRWMVRDRDIDFGIWNGVPKSKLIIPLDTHIARISRCLGLTGRRSSDWKTAVEITESLRVLDPDDPLKYDFALCHHGISGNCSPRDRSACAGCVLTPVKP